MKIINPTAYCGRSLKSFVVAACAALGHEVPRSATVRIKYARDGQLLYGRAVDCGTWMCLYVPRPERYTSSFDELFWATALHEVGHWKGWNHLDYPASFRWIVPQPAGSCYAKPPGLTVRLRMIPRTVDPLLERVRHALEEKVRTLERRIKSLTTRAKAWRRRLRAATARLNRRAAAGSVGES